MQILTYCRNCGEELEESAEFCSKCGTPVATRRPELQEQVVRKRGPLSPWAIAGIAVAVVALVVAVVMIPFLLGGWFPFTRVVGSGDLRTQEEFLSGFVNVDVGSGFQVSIVQGSYKVLITADDNLFDYIEVFKTGDTLTIGLEPGVGFQTLALRAEISMPDLEALQFSGGVTGNATGLVLSHDVKVVLSGGSILDMKGEAGDLSLLCSGGSNAKLSDFAVANVDVELSGGSQGTINLTGTLNADLSGGSHLFYIGTPELGEINTSGGSEITRLTTIS